MGAVARPTSYPAASSLAARGRARRWRRGGMLALLALITLTAILPVLWMVGTSLKTQTEYLQNGWLWPTHPTLEAYVGLFTQAHFARYFLNSVVVTVASVVLLLLVGAMAAFALSRYRFSGRGTTLSYLLLGQMVPATALMVPLYLVVRDLQMLNTYQGLILPYIAGSLPFVVFLLRGFFLTIPSEIEDVARMDGCGEWQLFWRVVLPLGAPGLATAGVFEFLFIWNDFLLALILMQETTMRTLTLAVFQAVGEYGTQVPSLFAGLTISAVPVIVAYLLFARQLIQGITAGALKG